MKISLPVSKIGERINQRKKKKKTGQWPESLLVRNREIRYRSKVGARQTILDGVKVFVRDASLVLPTLVVVVQTFVQKSGFVEKKGDTVVFLSSNGKWNRF